MRDPEPWDAVFMNVCRALAGRSKDDSSRFGSLVVAPDNRVLGVGFNGPPPQVDDARVPWQERRRDRLCKYDMVVHAELNAILAALDGHGARGLAGARLYVNGHPCGGCVLHAVRAGVAELVWDGAGRAAVCVGEAERGRVAALLRCLKPGVRFALREYRGG